MLPYLVVFVYKSQVHSLKTMQITNLKPWDLCKTVKRHHNNFGCTEYHLNPRHHVGQKEGADELVAYGISLGNNAGNLHLQ